jgi:hypothetical protein
MPNTNAISPPWPEGVRAAHPSRRASAAGACGGRRLPLVARPAALAAALAGTILLTAACAGGDPAATSGATSTASSAALSGSAGTRLQRALAYTQCMRSHGAPGYPDPNSDGTFVRTSANSAAFDDAPRSARQACSQLEAGTKPSLSPALQAQQDRQNLAFAACMRRHGFPKFPDNWNGGINVGQFGQAGHQHQHAAVPCRDVGLRLEMTGRAPSSPSGGSGGSGGSNASGSSPTITAQVTLPIQRRREG